ncbi:MAG TPA: Ig-like domain-containing protein [Vicinamibacterales bacterium]|jgi:hypothetical protein
MRRWSVLVGFLLTTGCASPTTPSVTLQPAPTVSTANPYYLSLAVDVGKGANAGHATLSAKVQNVLGTALVGFPVTFTTSVGTLSAGQALTDAAGIAATTLTASQDAKVSVTAGTKSTETIVVAVPPPTLPPDVPPILAAPPPPPPPPAPPGPTYGVAVIAAPTSVVAGGSSTLTATATPLNGAPLASAYDWDCTGDGVTDFTTVVNFQVCTYNTAGAIVSRVTAKAGAVNGSGGVTVTVAAAAPLFVAIVPADFAPLLGDSDNFTATVTSSLPLPGSLQWEWDHNGDGTYDLFIPSTLGASNTQAIAFGTHGVQTVKVRATDVATGRSAIGTVQVTVP